MGNGSDLELGLPPPPIRVSLRSPTERFFEKIERKPFGCWLWTGGTDPDGYGQFKLNRYMCRAHRLMFELIFGEIEGGKIVMHSCDNPSCVNPMHLRLGTVADNTADMMDKGRGMIGERSTTSKLTATQATEIKNSGEPLRVLSERYGVHMSTIKRIKAGKAWGHLP